MSSIFFCPGYTSSEPFLMLKQEFFIYFFKYYLTDASISYCLKNGLEKVKISCT